MRRFALILAIAVSAIACTASSGVRPDASGGTDGGRMGVDGSITPIDAQIPFEMCVTDQFAAETRLRPVDIIWTIDRSGSMRGEADQVQMRINDFARAIAATGIDYHVVMISSMSFVTVPPPLGTDASRFLYVEEDVQSSDGMSDTLAVFDRYSTFLRRDAALHFVVVTDDSSGMVYTDFRRDMEMRLQRRFTYHAICSPPGSTHTEVFVTAEGCQGPDDAADGNGDDYWALAGATGGQRLSICTGDWSTLFAQLTASIALPVELPCRYGIPDPGGGMAVDRNLVNMLYTPMPGVTAFPIPSVGSYDNCGERDGWYYEGNDILVCPHTCAVFQNEDDGVVEIALGCQTILI